MGAQVTIRRQTDGNLSRLVKGWMLGVAGRLDAPVPLAFKEEPAVHSVEGDLYGSARDVVRVLQPDSAVKALPTWEHAGLIVSASPAFVIVLAPAGLHGVHHVTVTAENAAAAKQMWNRVSQGVLRPGIYSAYSEEEEVEAELRITAQGKADTLESVSSQALYVPRMDPRVIEAKLRTDPEVMKRLAAAQGQYDISFRIDKPYRKVVMRWTELTAYSRADGSSQGERALGQTAMPAPRMPAQPGSHLVARMKLESLKPGAYRISLQGESPAGELLKIDERTYWFDGKKFEEL